MSGGAHNYAYSKVVVFVESLEAQEQENPGSMTPTRKAFCEHLFKVSEAMRMIEWVDSGDSMPASENEAILSCLSVCIEEKALPENSDVTDAPKGV